MTEPALNLHGGQTNSERLTPSQLEPLVVSSRQAASMCGVSSATWARRVSAGQTIAPLRFGGRILFEVDALRRWVALGMPSRQVWEATQKAVKK
jgi:hypothetical protein